MTAVEEAFFEAIASVEVRDDVVRELSNICQRRVFCLSREEFNDAHDRR